MSRVIYSDFERMETFLKNYSLEKLTEDDDFKRELKLLHRKLYSFMVFNSELISQNKARKKLHNITTTYIKEAVSDIVLALFCWVHGAYKPANLQLRSSIENFLKGILYESIPTIVEEKRVYLIFNLAKENTIFNNEIGEKHFNSISHYYSKLCQVAHGEINSLSEIDALKLFPVHDNHKSNEFILCYTGLLDSMLAMIYMTYYTYIYKMHEFNIELFL